LDKQYTLSLEGTRSSLYSIFLKQELKQMYGKSIDQFITRLRQKAKNCEFLNIDSENRSQIIFGAISQQNENAVFTISR
jgi:hypothetical protein